MAFASIIRQQFLQRSLIISRACSNKKTHYETLEVQPTATRKEIRHAFLHLSKLHHPDSQPHLGGRSDSFNAIREAYSVLSNAQTRSNYDYELLRRTNPDCPPPDHPLARFYKDGTIYTGPKETPGTRKRFTNAQVVIGAIIFAFVGGAVQFGVVRYFNERRLARAELIHRMSLAHIAQVRGQHSAGETELQKNLAEWRKEQTGFPDGE